MLFHDATQMIWNLTVGTNVANTCVQFRKARSCVASAAAVRMRSKNMVQQLCARLQQSNCLNTSPCPVSVQALRG